MTKPIDDLDTNINKCKYCSVGILEENKHLYGCLLNYSSEDREPKFTEKCTIKDMYICPRFFERIMFR